MATTHLKDKMGKITRIFHKWGALDLWRGSAWGAAGVCMYDGGGYAAEGNRVAQGGSFAALRHIPGGMHTYGTIMLILAAAVFYTSAKGGQAARVVLLCLFGFSIGIVVALIWGMSISHEVAWSAPSKWFLVAWLSVLLAATSDAYASRLRAQEREEVDAL